MYYKTRIFGNLQLFRQVFFLNYDKGPYLEVIAGRSLFTRPTDWSFRQRVSTLDQKVTVRRVLVIYQFEEFFVTNSEVRHQSLMARLSNTGIGAV